MSSFSTSPIVPAKFPWAELLASTITVLLSYLALRTAQANSVQSSVRSIAPEP